MQLRAQYLRRVNSFGFQISLTGCVWFRRSKMLGVRCLAFLALLLLHSIAALAGDAPAAPGKMVDLGGHRLHVNCTGKGWPAVVVENGLGDFSFDWHLVQTQVATFTRICTYDRAGYAWSDPGPK